MKESELADIVIKYYESKGYTIYSEVLYKPRGKRADIVAVKNNEYVVIETKMSMNLKLLEQAFFWKDKSHKTYLCFPSQRKINWFAVNMCKDYGIGIFILRKGNLQLYSESSVCKNPDLPKLYEQQKDSISGSKGGDYVTPFKITRDKLVNYVKKNGENTLISCVQKIDHHYSNDNSAKQSLTKMISIGVIDQLELFKKGRTMFVRYLGSK